MPASSFINLLGDTLVGKDGSVSTESALAGKKAVGLYFSAHWCPPCRGFTPELVKCYENSYKALGLEIVFVSSDRDEGAFKEYHGEQPWLALPFEKRDVKAALSKKYKVQGIPTFVILDGETGETITTDGREAVSDDPKGEQFPWKPPSFFEALGDEFLSGAEGETIDLSELKSKAKYIGLYFSAHWCGPCRGFTPGLIKAYTDHLKAKGLEIIFVSSDRNQTEFQDYYGTMPWLAIPQGDPRKSKLSRLFGVSGIPSFVLVDAETGATINGNARGKVALDPTGTEFPWFPKALNNMSAGEGLDTINEETALCVLLGGCSSKGVIDAAKAVLEPIAEAYKAKGDELLFLYADNEEGPVEQMRKLTKQDKIDSPQMVMIDIPDNGGYYVSPASEVTADTVEGFISAYKAKGLERQQMG